MANLCSRLFGIDARSLAAFRIGLGILLLIDLAIRATALEAHYSDAGALPRAALSQQYADTWVWSVHLLSGSVAVQAVLFVIAAAAALAIVIGWHSRLANVLSWVLLLSLQVRNPLVNNGGDLLLRALVFWSMFLPLDLRWSLAALRQPARRQRSVLSVASAGLLIQLALMYWMAGYYKLQGAWAASDTLERILQSDCYAKPLAYSLLNYPDVLAVMGWLSLWTELVLPVAIFSPICTRLIRGVAILWFGIFHLGIHLTLTVGLFSFVCWVAWIPFLPAEFWDWLQRTSRSTAAEAMLEAPNGLQAGCPSGRGQPWVVNLVAATALSYIVLWNISSISSAATRRRLPTIWRNTADLFGLRQTWNMFQRPMRDDGWYVVVARLGDGRVVDLLRDGAPADWESYRKPDFIYRRFPNHRWRKYYRNLVADRRASYREPLCSYLARQWELEHPQGPTIESIELHYMQEVSDDPAEADRFQQRFLCTWTPGESAAQAENAE